MISIMLLLWHNLLKRFGRILLVKLGSLVFVIMLIA